MVFNEFKNCHKYNDKFDESWKYAYIQYIQYRVANAMGSIGSLCKVVGTYLQDFTNIGDELSRVVL